MFAGLGAIMYGTYQQSLTEQTSPNLDEMFPNLDEISMREDAYLDAIKFNYSDLDALQSLNDIYSYSSFRYSYPEKVVYVIGLTPEERMDFINEATKPVDALEILSRYTYVHNETINNNEWLRPKFPSILYEKISGPWNIDSEHHQILEVLGKNPDLDTLFKLLALDNFDPTKVDPPFITFSALEGDANGCTLPSGGIIINALN